jgi:hypothetical protein
MHIQNIHIRPVVFIYFGEYFEIYVILHFMADPSGRAV